MNYNLEDIEDQIIATLQANANLSSCTIRTHYGDINTEIFKNPALMEGLVTQLPFIFVQYNFSRIVGRDDISQQYVNEVKFRMYAGTSSLRARREGQIAAYQILREIYDSVNGKIPNYVGVQKADNISLLDGTQITTPNFVHLSPMMKTEGDVENLVFNLPSICVYQTDYRIRLII